MANKKSSTTTKTTSAQKKKTKKTIKPAPSYRKFEDFLYERLQDPELALLYLKECLADEDPRIFLRALKDVCAAHGIKAVFSMPKSKKLALLINPSTSTTPAARISAKK